MAAELPDVEMVSPSDLWLWEVMKNPATRSITKEMKSPAIAIAEVVPSYFNSPRHLFCKMS